MDINIGKIGTGKNFFVKEPESKGEAKLKDQKFEQENQKKKRRIINKSADNIRINDYDFNIMEEYAYKDLDDDVLKLEFSITTLENKINKINNEISTLEELDSGIILTDLKFKRDIMNAELKKLRNEYEKQSFSNEISYRLSKLLEKFSRGNLFLACSEFIQRHILPLCSEKFKNSIEVKDSLNSLYNINSKVNELIKTKVPYGESDNRYEQLSAFINKANYLQSKIIRKKGENS